MNTKKQYRNDVRSSDPWGYGIDGLRGHEIKDLRGYWVIKIIFRGHERTLRDGVKWTSNSDSATPKTNNKFGLVAGSNFSFFCMELCFPTN